MLILCSPSWAGINDYNPAFEGTREVFKYTYENEDDVEGEGYMMVRENVNTNNLSLLEYMHASGAIDYEDLLSSRQKTTHTSDSYYIMGKDGSYVKNSKGANSEITYTVHKDLVQSPYAIAFGTGWYTARPVIYDSLLKEKTVAKSYQESAMMHHQLEYARGYEGSVDVNLNCTGPTADAEGTGLIKMKIDDYVSQGMVHIGQLVSDPSRNYKSGYNSSIVHSWKNPIINEDANYIGTFYIKKDMEVKIKKPKPTEYEDWLPCCFGGISDMDEADRKAISEESLFDCSCAETTISKPA